MFKKKRDEEHDCMFCDEGRVEKVGVCELIESVQVMSQQLEILLAEVTTRDDVVEKLEMELEERIMIIANLTKDIEHYEEVIRARDLELKDKEKDLEDRAETIVQKVNKIKRLEDEVQQRFEDNQKLKEDLEKVRKEKEELEKKIKGICGIIKD